MTEITVSSNNLENFVLGELTPKFSARGDRILRYTFDLRHTKLNLHRELSASDIWTLQSKVDALVASWDEKFALWRTRHLFQSGKDAAEEITGQSIAKIESLGRILTFALKTSSMIRWEDLKDHAPYPMPAAFHEAPPISQPIPEPAYVEPRISFFDKLFGKRAKKIEAAQEQHAALVDFWRGQEDGRAREHSRKHALWLKREKAFWEAEQEKERAYLTAQAERNREVDEMREAVRAHDASAVVDLATMVLDMSDYEGLFQKQFLLQYRPAERFLMIAYDLPAPDKLPIVKNAKFVKATGEIKESLISEKDQKANFEAVAYQICLRTLHELFEADEDGNFEQILFNGYVDFIDPRTGRDARSCVLSILVKKEEFTTIDLARVEPKTCFKSLKGVSAGTLASLTPIPPVMDLDRDDERFVDGKEVAGGFDESTNLASIPWEDFEHLIRELFEKEFLSRGGEVKVTQASRDGGVDAVAFDPDPISGGKIVIQAKRYTRTVGVSAVRDLYGTVLNEGASKGILVTTADFGPDAYQFANGKPLTLMGGSNLLFLLQRHGYRAKIDLKEARDVAAGRG